ncbi:MAG: TetR/AcrR family transcriptional regulator [Caulobacteraceae bacterium]
MIKGKLLQPDQPSVRTEGTRRRVLDAAERLLRKGDAAFSMRELASEAGVSFATPFNLFGSKVGIIHAISAERIEAMTDRFGEATPEGDAAARVLAAVEIAAAVMLDSAEVNRAVMGALGAPHAEPGSVYRRSRALWAQAIALGDGLEPGIVGVATSALPDQLAIAFRGVLSFWTAGEIADADLVARCRAAAATMLVGFVGVDRRTALLAEMVTPQTVSER